ncbi:hypothetical protein Tco_0217174 [Tanacetum coccineum]
MIIPGPADIVQQAKLLKERGILLGWDGAVMSTQEYMQKVIEDVDENDDFNRSLRIHIEQRIAAMMGYRGGSGGCFEMKNRIGIVSTPYRNLVPRFSRNAGEMSRNDYEFCKRVANHVGYRFGNEQIIKGCIFVLVVNVIVGVIVVVFGIVVGGCVSSIFKLCFVIVDSFFFAIGVPLVPVFLLVLSVYAMLAACAFKAVATLSATSCRMASKVMAGVSDVDVLLGGILSTQDNA